MTKKLPGAYMEIGVFEGDADSWLMSDGLILVAGASWCMMVCRRLHHYSFVKSDSISSPSFTNDLPPVAKMPAQLSPWWPWPTWRGVTSLGKPIF